MLLSCLKTKTSNQIDSRHDWSYKKISWAVSFFINHGGKVHSPQCFPLSIAASGLEVLFDCYFKIEALKKLKLLEHLNDIIGGNYHELIKASVQPIEYIDYLAS